LDFNPAAPIAFDRRMFLANVRSARRGVSGGPSGMRAEHLQTLLDHEDTAELLAEAAEHLARAELPAAIVSALRFGRMTALSKRDGGVRGIVTGDTLRRLTARTLAQCYAREIEDACTPYQFALSTRAGADALAHLLRAALDLDAKRVVVSLDGIGAFDHIRRSAMLEKLGELPNTNALLPFVRLFYSQPSRYLWYDDDGREHEVVQGEGGEQGDPLMPLLYALGQHRALVEASASLQPGEHLLAFLDDLYVVTSRDRAAEVFRTVAESVEHHAGVRTHLGKLAAWSPAGGDAPPGLPAHAWKADKPPPENGLLVLGASLGSPEFVSAHAQERLQEESELLDQLPELGDVQSAWCLLLQCAVPRANHLLRQLAPPVAHGYAEAHDAAILKCLGSLLQANPELPRRSRQARAASVPLCMGGAGLRNAVRISPGAYWAAWADALPVIAQRVPALAAQCIYELGRSTGTTTPCLYEAREAARSLDRSGFADRPGWQALADGARPTPPREPAEPGEWPHGWQFHACRASELYFRDQVFLPSLPAAHRAAFRSSSGPGAGHWLMAIPASRDTEMQPELFQVALRRRLRLPLPASARRCPGRRCQRHLDPLGDHLASCTRVGGVQRRAKPLERAWQRVFREAGGRVLPQCRLSELNLGLRSTDGRRVDLVARGLPLFDGVPVCGDATMVSPLHANGTPWAGAEDHDGVALSRTRRKHEDDYSELVGGSRARLLVLGCEVFGR